MTYGRVEGRIKIPSGQGIWPAFWMLGQDIDVVGWPKCGEIDIMENIGREPATIHGTIHGPNYFGARGISEKYSLKEGPFADRFHIFPVEWDSHQISFFVDGNAYFTVTRAAVEPRGKWVYDHPFYLLLNAPSASIIEGESTTRSSRPPKALCGSRPPAATTVAFSQTENRSLNDLPAHVEAPQPSLPRHLDLLPLKSSRL